MCNYATNSDSFLKPAPIRVPEYKSNYPRWIFSSSKMSEQSISQKSSSDFSIARILSDDISPNLKITFSIKETIQVEDKKFSPSNERRESDKLTEVERLQPGNLNSEVLGDFENKEENRRSEMLERELPWLRCTRYSPPKLPRRPGAGKQTKRRLGSHPRIPFTKFQIQVLEEKYRISAYLSRRDVIQLAGTLNLPQNRVKIWFQNRRARERRESQIQNPGPDS